MKAIPYQRVSTGKQAESGLSLDDQADRIAVELARRGWDHAATYTDAGKSGRSMARRPELRAALEVLRTIRDEGLLDHIYETGEMLAKGLAKLIAAHPNKCVEARGYGLLRGLELSGDDPELLGRIVTACRQRGLLINGIAGRVLRMTPPLIIERGHVRFALDVLDEALGTA